MKEGKATKVTDLPIRGLTKKEREAEMAKIRKLTANKKTEEEKKAEVERLMKEQEVFVNVAAELGCKIVSSEKIRNKLAKDRGAK